MMRETVRVPPDRDALLRDVRVVREHGVTSVTDCTLSPPASELIFDDF